MKKHILFLLLSLLTLSFAASAQEVQERYTSTRLENQISQLKRQTVDLAEETSDNISRAGSNTRADLDAAFLAQQLDASAGLFQQMYRDGRRASELRDAGAILSDLARRAPSYGSNSYIWRDVQNTIADINRELGNSNSGGGNNNNNNPVLGRAFWRGMVDSRVRLEIRGNSMIVTTMAGNTYGEGTFSFANTLPRQNVSVGVNKTKGRGSVQIVQQPNRNNDYTAIIDIIDNDGGAREYQLEIFWR